MCERFSSAWLIPRAYPSRIAEKIQSSSRAELVHPAGRHVDGNDEAPVDHDQGLHDADLAGGFGLVIAGEEQVRERELVDGEHRPALWRRPGPCQAPGNVISRGRRRATA
jgi:hypothetical protein